MEHKVELLLFVPVIVLYNTFQMENPEPNNYARFKWVSPFCHVIALLIVASGPHLFPIIYWKFTALVLLYGFCRLIYMFVCGLIIIYRATHVRDL